MSGSGLATQSTRSEGEILSDLRALCSSSGYIHAIAYFCWRDNLIKYTGQQLSERDLDHQYSHDRLLRTEISTLIGFMVQAPLDLSLPTPVVLQEYLDRTEALMHELHHALMRPMFEGWDLQAGQVPHANPFTRAAVLREPIFYTGESAYNFQHRELALLKYRADDDWLERNKGFRIDDACRMAEILGQLLTDRQIECSEHFREKPPDQWTMLPGFVFTASDVASSAGVALQRAERFLDAFSCGPEICNASFLAVNDFNVTNSTPILKREDGSYILLQPYSLLETVYETPFFWMGADRTYSSTASTNRGHFTECFAADRLEAVFGAGRVYRNVDMYRGKNRLSEVDVLVIYGSRAIVVQAKSKRLTIEARKGNDHNLRTDFKKAIQDAYDQALLCSQALIDDDVRLVLPSGVEVAINSKPRIIFPVCIVSDHYPALAFQAREFLTSTVTEVIQPPLVTDVFSLDTITEMLDTPLHLINYLALRARFGDKILVTQELAILGFHLKQNLWLGSEYDMVNLGDDLSGAVDVAMMARRAGVLGEKTPKGILTRFKDRPIGRLIDALESAGDPQLLGLSLLLLQTSSQTAKALNEGIDQISRAARRDRQQHDISIAVDGGKAGLTIHCNWLSEELSRERLYAHCRLRKYDTKADVWYGVTLEPVNGDIRSALVLEEAWKPDPQMEVAVAAWPKKPASSRLRLTVPSAKIGRNDPCPCGSGRKYKKCCLNG